MDVLLYQRSYLLSLWLIRLRAFVKDALCLRIIRDANLDGSLPFILKANNLFMSSVQLRELLLSSLSNASSLS
jgi:hypothetical protein